MGTGFFTVPPLEPILSPQTSTADLQLAASIEAWEVASWQGWQEPEPADLQAELKLPLDDQPALLGSSWDSWSSNAYLEQQQIEELPGFAAHELS